MATRTDAIVERFKNHPIVAILLVAGGVVVGLASFTDATRRLFNTASELRPAAPVEIGVTIGSPVVNVRWSGWKAGAADGLWHPVRRTPYENELRLPLTFTNPGKEASTIDAITLRSKAGGRDVTWEAVYEADDAAVVMAAPIEAQIREHRKPLGAFVVAPNGQVTKIIDFVLSDAPEALPPGPYANVLQVRTSASGTWTDRARFLFTIPPDFTLQGVDASGVSFSRYNYWQTFPIDKP